MEGEPGRRGEEVVQGVREVACYGEDAFGAGCCGGESVVVSMECTVGGVVACVLGRMGEGGDLLVESLDGGIGCPKGCQQLTTSMEERGS